MRPHGITAGDGRDSAEPDADDLFERQSGCPAGMSVSRKRELVLSTQNPHSVLLPSFGSHIGYPCSPRQERPCRASSDEMVGATKTLSSP